MIGDSCLYHGMLSHRSFLKTGAILLLCVVAVVAMVPGSGGGGGLHMIGSAGSSLADTGSDEDRSPDGGSLNPAEDPFSRAEWDLLVADVVRKGLDLFEKDINEAFNQLNRGLTDAYSHMRKRVETRGERFSEHQLNRRTIARLGGLMAMDRVDGGGRFENWMDENLFNDLQPVLRRYAEEVSRAVAHFERRMETAMADFDKYVYQQLQDEVKNFPKSLAATELEARIAQHMRSRSISNNIQFSLAVATLPIDALSIAMAFPAVRTAIINTLHRSLASLVTKITGTAAGTKASAWVAPVAIAVGTVGVSWSSYDIYRLRGRAQRDFNRELRATLNQQSATLTEEVRSPALAYINELIQKYRQAAPMIIEDLQNQGQ